AGTPRRLHGFQWNAGPPRVSSTPAGCGAARSPAAGGFQPPAGPSRPVILCQRIARRTQGYIRIGRVEKGVSLKCFGPAASTHGMTGTVAPDGPFGPLPTLEPETR